MQNILIIFYVSYVEFYVNGFEKFYVGHVEFYVGHVENNKYWGVFAAEGGQNFVDCEIENDENPFGNMVSEASKFNFSRLRRAFQWNYDDDLVWQLLNVFILCQSDTNHLTEITLSGAIPQLSTAQAFVQNILSKPS